MEHCPHRHPAGPAGCLCPDPCKLHPGQTQLGAGVLQKLHPFAGGLHKGQFQFRLEDLGHDARKARPGAHVYHAPAITDPEGIEDKHFLDSLLFASQPEVAGRMVDVGAGAGFPGIVTKIYKPELELTLMEPTGKRVEFLKYACAHLDQRQAVFRQHGQGRHRAG